MREEERERCEEREVKQARVLKEEQEKERLRIAEAEHARQRESARKAEEMEKIRIAEEAEMAQKAAAEKRAAEIVLMKQSFEELRSSGSVILSGSVMAQGGDSIVSLVSFLPVPVARLRQMCCTTDAALSYLSCPSDLEAAAFRIDGNDFDFFQHDQGSCLPRISLCEIDRMTDEDLLHRALGFYASRSTRSMATAIDRGGANDSTFASTADRKR